MVTRVCLLGKGYGIVLVSPLSISRFPLCPFIPFVISFVPFSPFILIRKPEKPESLYLIFQERYNTIEEFLAAL